MSDGNRRGERMARRPGGLTIGVGVAAALLVAVPVVGTEFFVNFVLTRTLILGLAASSIVFLSSYVGMVSLAQYLLVGVAGFTIGNCVAESGKGLKLGLDPWLAVLLALVIATTVALLLGAVASRTTGIYFLMLTLTYAVIGYYVFGQVTSISGFGGITGVNPPSFFDTHPVRVYYAVLALSVLAYVGIRALRRSPFGLALEGIRDDPVRMSALGFNVPVHRTLAFTLGGLVAGSAGVINIWWNGQIDPNSVNIGATLDLFIIAVIGGISHLEGAWLGAFVFVVANNYMRSLPLVDRLGITEARFNTVVGALVLIIVVASPNGLMGLITTAAARLRGTHPEIQTFPTLSTTTMEEPT
jgi:branched-chain amino acid transport system permease protein